MLRTPTNSPHYHPPLGKNDCAICHIGTDTGDVRTVSTCARARASRPAARVRPPSARCSPAASASDALNSVVGDQERCSLVCGLLASLVPVLPPRGASSCQPHDRHLAD